ncbi:MAG TPA: AarF/UbiB family protein [Gemmatimonadaceae bacterium]|nr:AarF/UbiB family protein [Gemmatimonadaceae bacterium]
MLLAPRYIPRLAALVGLFTRYGLSDFAKQQGLIALSPDTAEPGPLDAEIAERARAFRKRLVDLGPAYIKLGQVLSTRPDLLPEPFVRELDRLQDDVGPIPFDDVEKTLQEEFGARISKLFASFDEEPIGTASLGQVHSATLRDGRDVVVKIQRPNIREQLIDDVEFFREVAAFLTSHTEAGRKIDMVGVIQQLERALSDELDYRIEARNAANFRRALAEFPRLLVPRIIEAYTSQRVLTMERIRGIKIDAVPRIARIEYDFTKVADEFAKAYLKQIAIDGHFHADPHPGNVFVVMPGPDNPRTPAEVVATDRRSSLREPLTPLSKMEHEAQAEVRAEVSVDLPTSEEPKLALIDFGMTAHLAGPVRERIIRLLLDLADNRGQGVAETMIEMGMPLEDFDRQSYIREIASLVAQNYDLQVGEVKLGRVLYEVINISYAQGLRLPAELTLLAKALFNLDAISAALDPTYSPIQAIRDYGSRIANERAKDDMSLRRIWRTASETTDLVSALPHRLDLFTSKLAANELGFTVDAPQLGALLRGLQKIANRIFTGLVLTGLLIASGMLLPYRRVLGTWGFVISGAIGIWMVVNILITDRGAHRRDR